MTIPAIIVKFTSRRKKDAIMRAIKEKKQVIRKSDVARGTHEGRVFIGDSLSPYYKKLLWMTKTAAKEKGYAHIWWKNGVCVRKEDGAALIRIECESDLNLLQ